MAFNKLFSILCILTVLLCSHISEAGENTHNHFKQVNRHVHPNGQPLPLPHCEYLDVHNKARTEVGVPPLKWNDTLAAYAQNYANSRYESSEFEHSDYSAEGYGECLAEGFGDLSPTEAVQLWVDEKKDYDYATNTCLNGAVCGHYTQVIWKDTTDVGCAKAPMKNGWMFVICNYSPTGNWEGEKPY